MAVTYFGQYLVDNGAISQTQLEAALSRQKNRNLPFGLIAMERKLLNPEQVMIVQHEHVRTGVSFWVVALEKHYVTKEQVASLIKEHVDSRSFIGEVIVELGFIDRERMKVLLQDYSRQRDARDADNTARLVTAPHRDVIEASVEETIKIFARLVRETVSVRTISVFNRTLPPAEYVFIQEVTGESPFTYALYLSPRQVVTVSAAMGAGEGLDISGMALDAVCEFVNIVVGGVCGRLTGKQASMHPRAPRCIKSPPPVPPPPDHALVDFLSPEETFTAALLFPGVDWGDSAVRT